MEHITDQTTIADLSKIHVPKCYEKCVYKAIGSSTKLMTIKEFIDTTEFNINPETFDILFMNINDEDIPIYIDDAMLDWMGYEGEKKLRKRNCRELIQSNFEDGSDYKILKNSIYKEFLDEETNKIKGADAHTFKSNFPKPATGSSARSIKHLIVMPDAFRSLCMMINTEKGKQIRKYYITLEKLIKSYNLYQTIYRGQEAERAMSCKGNKIDSLSLQISGQSQQISNQTQQISDQTRQIQELLNRTSYMITTLDETKEELKETNTTLKSVLPQRVDIKSNDPDYPQVFILRDLDAEEGDHNFYAMRCQTSNYNARLKELKAKYGDNIKRACTIKQPNAVVFWKSVKKTLQTNLICDSKTNWFSLYDMTKIQFKKKISELNDNRMNPV
jgi:hypothetical protein